jgi:hypothetical protein
MNVKKAGQIAAFVAAAVAVLYLFWEFLDWGARANLNRVTWPVTVLFLFALAAFIGWSKNQRMSKADSTERKRIRETEETIAKASDVLVLVGIAVSALAMGIAADHIESGATAALEACATMSTGFALFSIVSRMALSKLSRLQPPTD